MGRTNPLYVMNHFFSARLLLFFVVQHSLLALSSLKYGPAIVTHAMH